MRWLDRTIEAVAPVWAARREMARASLTAYRAYEAAKSGRVEDGWHTAGTSANAEIGPAAALIRHRARDLVRNNPWAAQAVRKLAGKVVGVGILPRLDVPSGDEKRRLREVWDAFAESCDPERRLDFYGLQHLAARTMFESGEVFVRLIWRPRSFGLRVPVQLQVLEPDWCDHGKNEATAAGGEIVQGVEFDRDGRRVAYWMFDRHPGEQSPRRASMMSAPVAADQVLHIFDPLRPGQARGVSAFTPAVVKLRDVDDFDEAEVVRKKIAACFAAFVQRPSGAASSPLGKAGVGPKGQRLETIVPGTWQYLNEGEEVTFASPPAAEGYLEFMQQQLRAIAAGVGVTYEQLTGDLSEVNFSSIRAGMIDFWDLVDHWQWHVLVPQLCQPVWSAVMARELAHGRPSVRARWTPPRRRWVDPAKEVAATKDAVRAGLLTLADAIAEQGEDPDDRLEEMARINARLDELGLKLDSDPRVDAGIAAPAVDLSAAQPD